MKYVDEPTMRKISELMQSFDKLNENKCEIEEAMKTILDCALIQIVPDPFHYYDYVVGDLKCDHSPLGRCVFNKVEDPELNTCVYCKLASVT